ncbi:substrate-binding domain-containing protein [Salisediminibacterium beveridgei]|uniref:ABC-type tungstate transport system, periplasmic binding protein n=1 Tax=Salisediminibacterium beveridgei TaxID=632773 RepID=A0A1D7QXW2_9BACI|nr:substrate-binding domain-containing protein [Salisediminibacterium beveridgei]AOM83840.1 ABC-type tungstate transport system, periplasmic binding protein [Salisediminibacterium beveridgei]
MKHRIGPWIVALFVMGLVTLSSACTWSDSSGQSQEEFILATTTSTYDSGLLDTLIPLFEAESGYRVKVIAVGSGAVLSMGEQGEADVLFTHAPDAEEELAESGEVVNRRAVMANEFVLLGPEDDPAGVRNRTAVGAFQTIAEQGAMFYSRGDGSGTHIQELNIWEESGVAPAFNGYEETGQGMAETLRIAAERRGYLLTDRGTYLSLRDELDTLTILVEGKEELQNPYHVMQVNPERFDQVNEQGAEAFVSFMVSDTARNEISSFGEEAYGEPLFFVD